MTSSTRVLLIAALVLVAAVYAHDGHDHDHDHHDHAHDHHDHAHDHDHHDHHEHAAPTKKQEPFVAPKPDGKFEFFESFSDSHWKQRWHIVDNAPYTGKWEVSSGSMDKGIDGDQGLIMSTPGARHAIVAAFDKVVDNKDKTLVVQYELRAENKFGCDGGYIKLLSESESFSPSQFKDGTPYTIMFGPDKCGTTDKVHFILRHKHPKTGEVEEKHLKDAPRVPADKLTHVYTLIVRADNSYEILIDGTSKSKGSLFDAMQPSINPPRQIDDPSDKKPADWIDEEYIADPEDKKPDDWDEDAPATIPDEAAVKPEGWSDDAPLTIVDPDAKQPSDWDTEEDGEWEAPQIPNPICEQVGCGEWKRPVIKNPAYKGKWSAKKIKNPEWVGVWAPRKIDNPAFVEDKHPSNVTPIAGLGIELLTNAGGLVFDNILVTHDEGVAERLRASTWEKRHNNEKDEYKAEASKEKKEKDFMQTVMEVFADHPIPICIGIITLSMLIFLVVYRCCLSDDEEPAAAAHPKKTDEKTKDDKEAKSEDSAAAAGGGGGAGGGKATPSKAEKRGKGSKKDDK